MKVQLLRLSYQAHLRMFQVMVALIRFNGNHPKAGTYVISGQSDGVQIGRRW